MTNLLTSPHHGLSPSFSPLMMRIIESHADLRSRNNELEQELRDIKQVNIDIRTRLQRSTTEHLLQIRCHEMRIEHLQSVIADLTNQVTQANLSSRSPPAPKIHGSVKETVYEFLRRTHKEHQAVPEVETTTSPLHKLYTPGSSSIDCPSNLKAYADSSSDEAESSTETYKDSDFGHVKSLAEIMARRHNMKLQYTLARLCDVFFDDTRRPSCSTQSSSAFGDSLNIDVLFGPPRSLPHTKPQNATLETPRHRRPFSFDAGDDSLVHFSTSHELPLTSKDPSYKRSVSLTNLPGHPVQAGFSLTQATVLDPGSRITLSQIDQADAFRWPEGRIKPSVAAASGQQQQASTRYHASRPRNPRRETSSSSTGTVLRRSPMNSTLSLRGV